MMKVITTICCLLLALSVTPNIGSAPVKATVKVRHPFENGDRVLSIGVFCEGDLLMLSEIPLAAGASPIYTRSITLPLPCLYTIAAVVTKGNGKETMAVKKIDVRGV